MEDDQLMQVTRYWSFWDAPPRASIPRDIALPQKLEESLVLVVQGVRRCGKSTLLAQMLDRYKLNPKHCAFLNFEDPRLGAEPDHTVLDRWVAAFRATHPRLKRAYFFLDEVQSVHGWERWLRTQLERPQGNHFVITGSNAQLLSGELGTVLTGRHQTVELFPLSWTEYRRVRKRATLEDYLRDGGFPEPLLIDRGDRLRQQYFIDIIERDVRERVGARSVNPVKQVVQMAFESAGSELSLRRVAGAAGIAVETAAGYLDACHAAYMLFAVPYFAFSERKRAARNKKYYPIDTGLRRMAVTKLGADVGKLLECAVFLELRRSGLPISYWRGKGEVDFVVQTLEGHVPIQVSWQSPTDRHLRAIEAFYEEFPQSQEAIFVGPAEFDDGVLARLVPPD